MVSRSINAPSDSLRLQGLQKRVGDFLLEADFTVGAGERAALIGRSGSGKTTLLRMIAGLEKVDAGRVMLGEKDVTELAPRLRNIGYVFQDQALFPALSVLENAVFGLKMKGVSREERNALGREWLGKIGLETRANSSIDVLSGGEKQRVAWVRALIWKPSVILLDEPFSALDPALRERLRAELLSLHALWPAPLILVSHDSEDRRDLATVELRIEETAGGSERRIVRI